MQLTDLEPLFVLVLPLLPEPFLLQGSLFSNTGQGGILWLLLNSILHARAEGLRTWVPGTCRLKRPIRMQYLSLVQHARVSILASFLPHSQRHIGVRHHSRAVHLNVFVAGRIAVSDLRKWSSTRRSLLRTLACGKIA